MAGDILAMAAARAPGVMQVRATSGDVLFRPGEDCRGFLAVRRGTVRVGLTAANGREIVLYRVGPGEICLQTFSCLVEGRTYGAEGVAEEAIDALLIPPPAFDALLAQDCDFRSAVLASVAGRFEDFEQVVQTLAFTGLEARLAGALLRLAGERDLVLATHEALAAEIGSAREVVSRQLGLMARQGLVSLARGRIVISRRGGLERLCLQPM